jgi:hypothetical protein
VEEWGRIRGITRREVRRSGGRPVMIFGRLHYSNYSRRKGVDCFPPIILPHVPGTYFQTCLATLVILCHLCNCFCKKTELFCRINRYAITYQSAVFLKIRVFTYLMVRVGDILFSQPRSSTLLSLAQIKILLRETCLCRVLSLYIYIC